MRSIRYYFLIVLIAAGGLVIGGGCSTTDVDESNPAALYEDAEKDIENDRYQIALDKLRKVKNKHPYSRYSTLAKLRIADVHFAMESFDEAAASYETFTELHPKHEKVPYAMYRRAESYYQAMPSTIARDLSNGYSALDAFQEYLRKFSTDAQAADARGREKELKSLLAEKQLYIGNFYFKRDFYEAAELRFEKVVEVYPESVPAKEATEKLAEIQSLLKDKIPPRHERTGSLIYQRYSE